MSNADRAEGDAAKESRPEDGVGDVESAGETTAAATAGGSPESERPVGADTMVKVEQPDGEQESGGG